MKKEIAEKWVEALRSGKYQQAVGKLRDKATNGFCCLGVLCDISGVGEWKWLNDDFGYVYKVPGDPMGQQGILPRRAVSWADMRSAVGMIEPALGDAPGILTHYNDQMGYSFEQIADLIEKNYERL